MSNIVIKTENLGKQYQLGQIGTRTLRKDFERWLSRKRGKEDPYLKIGQETLLGTNKGPQTGLEADEFLWALRDINFEVRQGEVLGIIGKNGAGKSTLLKILSQVTTPTTGEVKIKGRIASLLEVGTGFHPELTGRDNIFLNGAILGMTKMEIRQKFDEIVDFSGIEKYIDTPVKRYSSGMYVRLAFAVAAHLEPEILVVDEVLAVGDAEFQKKAIGKMQNVSHEKGRTVLFVSHNMQAIKQLCERAILLKSGKVVFDDTSSKAIEYYLQIENPGENAKSLEELIQKLPPDPVFKLLSIVITQEGRPFGGLLESKKQIEIKIGYQVLIKTVGLRIYFDLCDDQDMLILRSFHDENSSGIPTVSPGNYFSKAIIPGNILGPINYVLKIRAGIFNIRSCLPDGINIPIRVEHTGDYNRSYLNDTFRGKLALSLKWVTEEIK